MLAVVAILKNYLILVKIYQVALTKEILIAFLQSHKFDFDPNQHKLCFPKLARIYARMASGRDFPAIKVGNGKIVEGHHRYICSQILKIEIETARGGINMSQQNEYTWAAIIVDDIDWDKPWELRRYQKDYD